LRAVNARIGAGWLAYGQDADRCPVPLCRRRKPPPSGSRADRARRAPALYTLSQHASLVFAPFSIHGGRFYDGHGSEIDARLKQLPVTVLVLAVQDVALESDPGQPAEGEQPAPPHNARTAARDTRQTEE
jgi:hypothetical protein